MLIFDKSTIQSKGVLLDAEPSLIPSAIDCTVLFVQLLENQPETSSMRIADLILPVFAVILTGWIVGYTGYLSRALSDALIHFAYNIAMPALLIVTIAQEPSHSLINWRFLVAFVVVPSFASSSCSAS